MQTDVNIYHIIGTLVYENTAKADCAGTFCLVYKPAQLFRSIDKSSWAGSKTSQKSPAQSAFTVEYCT